MITDENKEALGRALYERLETQDPSLELITWDNLSDFEQCLYRDCAYWVVLLAKQLNLFNDKDD